MKLLYVAIDRARAILSADNAAAIKTPYAAYVLAKGALMAAAKGETDLSRLSAAACEHWAETTADRMRVASYALH
jgi:hypothetical protein